MTQHQQPIPNEFSDRKRFMLIALATQGGILLVACLLGWLVREPFWQTLVITPRTLGLGVLFSIPLTLAAIFLEATPLSRLQQIQTDFEMVINLFKGCTIFDLLLLSLLAGIGEEALFRGVLQPLVQHYTSPLAALLIVSVIFGLMHVISKIYALLVFFIGLYLGGLYLYFDDLVIPITTHAAYDFFALLYGTRFALSPNKTSNHE